MEFPLSLTKQTITMKTIHILRFFIFTVLLGVVPDATYAQIPTNGLVGFYPFNGNANDESGNQYNGIPVNVSSISDRFGSSDRAYAFNGESGYISLPTCFDILPRTIDLWFNSGIADYSEFYGGIYQSDNPTLSNGNTGIAVLEINGQKKLLLTICGVSDTIDISTNIWYNVAIVANANKEIYYYLNGELLRAKTFSTFVTSDNGLNNTIIGANRILTTNYFKGIIDDIRIYNRVLYQREIQQIYYEGACANSINVIDTLIIYTNLVTSNPAVYQNSIKVYPNPTNDYLTIDCGTNYSMLSVNSIKITNASGQTMFKSPVNRQFYRLDLSGWTGNGLYLIYILDSQNNTIDVRKILLE
jgi:hypothetical protein